MSILLNVTVGLNISSTCYASAMHTVGPIVVKMVLTKYFRRHISIIQTCEMWTHVLRKTKF